MLETYGEILNLDEVCEILRIGRNRAYELLQSHRIRAFRLGRNWKVPKQSLIDFIDNTTEEQSQLIIPIIRY